MDTPKPVPRELINSIEQQWKSRMKTQNYVKPSIIPGDDEDEDDEDGAGSELTVQHLEVEFFAGVMTALSALGYAVPPRWVVTIIAGQWISDLKPLEA